MTIPLQLDGARTDNAAVVTVRGSATMGEADTLRRALEDLADQRVNVIVLDLGEMDFISSLGLEALIAGHLRCRHHAGQVRLVRPTPQVRELLETTRLTRLFSVFDSVGEALK